MADFLCALPLVAGLFSACAPPAPLATGYAEGDYVLVAPAVSARIATVPVREGEHVAAGALLATVEDRDARMALAAAEAGLRQAESQLANLLKGSRPEELAVIEANVASARANAQRTATEEDRQEKLVRQHISSQAELDAARAAATVAASAGAEAEARLAVARLPARSEEVAAARAAVAQAEANRDAAQWQLDQRRLGAPKSGTVSELVRHPGDMAGPSVPVLSFLPDDGLHLRFYVAEADLAAMKLGARVKVECDGCPAMSATITRIADQAEFTPPVIYSRDARQKLVYRIEAAPEPADALKPGQIVEIRALP